MEKEVPAFQGTNIVPLKVSGKMIFIQRRGMLGSSSLDDATSPALCLPEKLTWHLKFDSYRSLPSVLERPIFRGDLLGFREARPALPAIGAQGLPAKDHSVHRPRSLHCRQ